LPSQGAGCFVFSSQGEEGEDGMFGPQTHSVLGYGSN
jgi:hypothetical protein